MELMEQKYRRILTNVNDQGVVVSTYKAMVTSPNGTEVVVSPKSLLFKEKYEKKSHTLTIKYKENKEKKGFIWLTCLGRRKWKPLS